MGCSSCGKNKSMPARKRIIPKQGNGATRKRTIGNGTTRKKRPIPSRRRPR